jgi:uncharacterized protein (DUF1800 family)
MNARSENDPLSPDKAWAPYEPAAGQPWDLPRAGHLYRRAAFGAAWSQLQQALREGPAATVDRLLHPQGDPAAPHRTFDDDVLTAATGGSTETLRAAWLRRMIDTPHPLLERVTLFWHGHFAISNAGVNNAALMARHMQSLRAGALGSYRALLMTVMDDPALYLALRSDSSRRAQPNENVARQLLQAYGPGPDHFDDRDVQQAARALTGRFVLRNQLRLLPREFDDGSKTLLGQTGNWTARDAVEIVASHPATAAQVVHKLYACLISECEPPDDRLLAPLVAEFHRTQDLLQLVGTMLRSNLFFSPRAYRRRIKSPVEFAVGLVRAMEARVSTTRLAQHLAELGQDLYRPPTPAGWPGGRHWLNRATLIGRHNLAGDLLAAAGAYEGRLDPRALTAKYQRNDPDEAARMLLDLLLQGDVAGPPQVSVESEPDLRSLATFIVRSPEYQLA